MSKCRTFELKVGYLARHSNVCRSHPLPAMIRSGCSPIARPRIIGDQEEGPIFTTLCLYWCTAAASEPYTPHIVYHRLTLLRTVVLLILVPQPLRRIPAHLPLDPSIGRFQSGNQGLGGLPKQLLSDESVI